MIIAEINCTIDYLVEKHRETLTRTNGIGRTLTAGQIEESANKYRDELIKKREVSMPLTARHLSLNLKLSGDFYFAEKVLQIGFGGGDDWTIEEFPANNLDHALSILAKECAALVPLAAANL